MMNLNRFTTRVDWLRRGMALAALVLVAATWPLWTGGAGFPQVPLFGWAGAMPAWLERAILGAMLASLAAVVMAPARRVCYWRGGLLVFVAAAGVLCLANQQRLQPWAYEFLLAGLVLAIAPTERAGRLLRVLVISIYVWSALSKVDVTFFESYGQYLVSGLLNNVGLTMDRWPEGARRIAAALLPLGELLVAAGLAFGRTRRWALALSIVMHLLLMAALGPWGLNHRPGVLLWNVFFIGQNVLLFGPLWGRSAGDAHGEGGESPPASFGWRTSVATGVVAVAVLLPVLEPRGWFDVWPSWGVYASRPGRVLVYVRDTARARLPAEVQPFVEPPAPLEEWCRLRIDRWSLAAVSAPLSPQERFQVGAALAVAERQELGGDVKLVIESSADRWTGERSLREFIGTQAIEERARQFRLNAIAR